MSNPARWIDPATAAEIEATDTTAFRLAWGEGCQVERFGTTAVVSARSNEGIMELCRELESRCKQGGWSPSRIFRKLLVRSPEEKDTPELVRGEKSLDPREIVRESGLLFEVDFSASYSPGLFCDQRANRDFLRRMKPSRVLNTFAYTCAFSVAAASVGAGTVSVDISKSSLQRGRRNFELNGIGAAGHAFVTEDVLTYLARLVRRGEKFDAIILDPPTFGRGSGKRTFRVERDFAELVQLAHAVAAPGARILLSTNFQEWTREDLRAKARAELPRGTLFEEIPPAPDYFEASPSVGIWTVSLP